MLILIDNYDSFTCNLAQYLGELGADVRVERNDAITVEEIEGLAPSHIVISPGPCTPNEAGISMHVVRRFAGEVPILGVCLGHQAIGQVFGGRIVRAGGSCTARCPRSSTTRRGCSRGSRTRSWPRATTRW